MKLYKVTLYFPVGGDPEPYPQPIEAKDEHEAATKAMRAYREVNPSNPCFGKAVECRAAKKVTA